MPDPLKRLIAWLWQLWPLTMTIVVVIGFLISKIYPVVKAWLELKKADLDAKKATLEIQKLQREEKIAETLVRAPTFDEVKAYDPKARQLDRLNQGYPVLTKEARSPGTWARFIWTILFILLIPLWLLYFIQHGGLASK